MVGGLIRLRWTIQRRTPSWKRRLGLAAGLVGALATWAAVWLAAPAARADVLAVVLVGWLVGWLVGPVLTSGAAVLRPEYFALLPLERRRLGLGLLASVFVGVGAVVTGLAVLAVVGYALAGSTGSGAQLALLVALVALVAAGLLLVFVVALARAVYALVGAAMRTRLGIELAAIQYGLLLSSTIVGWVLVSPVVSAVPAFLAGGFAGGPAGAVLGLLPSGWPLRAVDATLAGDVAGALGWLAALAGAAAVAVLAAAVLLAPHVGARTTRRRRRPWGSRVVRGRRLLPAGPVGAVLGKELRTWWRDPWRSLEARSAIWFGVFVAGYGAIGGLPQLAALSGVAVALVVGLTGANLYGQDGTALWLLVVAQSPRALRADVRGRQLGLVLAFGVPAVALTVLMMALTGTWGYALPVGAVLLAALGAGCGMAAVLAVLGVTPGVDPHRRVNPNDAGENGLVLQVAFWLLSVLIAPTVAMAVVLAFAPGPPAWFGAATAAVAVLDAALVAWAGGALAVARLQARLPETFARLRYPGTVVTAPGGDLLDRFARQAESSAIEAAEARAAKAAR